MIKSFVKRLILIYIKNYIQKMEMNVQFYLQILYLEKFIHAKLVFQVIFYKNEFNINYNFIF